MKLNQFPHEKDLHIPVIIKLGSFLFFFPYFFTFLLFLLFYQLSIMKNWNPDFNTIQNTP